MAEFWNYVAIGCLVASIGYNAAYFLTHRNGKKVYRLCCAGVLSVSLVFRVLRALKVFTNAEFSENVRPWVGLIYLLPAKDAYIDWNKRK